jgi:hypothetical protein
MTDVDLRRVMARVDANARVLEGLSPATRADFLCYVRCCVVGGYADDYHTRIDFSDPGLIARYCAGAWRGTWSDRWFNVHRRQAGCRTYPPKRRQTPDEDVTTLMNRAGFPAPVTSTPHNSGRTYLIYPGVVSPQAGQAGITKEPRKPCRV